MADISTIAPVSIRRFNVQRAAPKPRLGIGATLAALAAAVGGAFNLAYVDPYSSGDRRQVPADGDLEGRDPRW